MKTLSDILDEMTDYRRSINLSPHSERTTTSSIRLFMSYLDENFQVDTPPRIRSGHLHTYLKHVTTLKNRKGLPITANGINGRLYGARAFLEFMKMRGYIAVDMLKHIPLVKKPTLLPTSVLTHSQVKKIMKVIDLSTKEGRRDRAIMELLYSTGVRGGELVKLTLEDVNLEAAVMKVMGKGSKERMVPIGKTALRHLTNYILGVRPFMKGNNTYRAVFLNYRAKPYKQKSLQSIVPKYAKLAKVDVHVTPHTYRRSCATEMIRGNANIYHVKELLGHESIDTLKPYTKLTIMDLKKTHAKCHPREKDS